MDNARFGSALDHVAGSRHMNPYPLGGCHFALVNKG
jgi:hypothetical protein